jgi:hypothetical protein
MAAIMRFFLDDLAARGFRYVINTSGGRLTVLQSIAMGWKSVAAMEPVARRSLHNRTLAVVREHTRGRRLIWRLGHVEGELSSGEPDVLRRLYREGSHGKKRAGLLVTVDPQPRSRAMAELAARLPDDGRIRHVRDRAFFDWRFQNPAREYSFLFAERNGKLEGWLAVARNLSYRPPMLPFHVSDWEGTSPAVRVELLRHAISWGRFPALGAWTGTMPVEDRNLLASSGFRPSLPALRARGMPCTLLKKLDGPGEWNLGGKDALSSSSWDVRLVDSMHG